MTWLWFHLLKPNFDSIWIFLQFKISPSQTTIKSISNPADYEHAQLWSCSWTRSYVQLFFLQSLDLPVLANPAASLTCFWFQRPKTTRSYWIFLLFRRLLLCVPHMNAIFFFLWCCLSFSIISDSLHLNPWRDRDYKSPDSISSESIQLQPRQTLGSPKNSALIPLVEDLSLYLEAYSSLYHKPIH